MHFSLIEVSVIYKEKEKESSFLMLDLQMLLLNIISLAETALIFIKMHLGNNPK